MAFCWFDTIFHNLTCEKCENSYYPAVDTNFARRDQSMNLQLSQDDRQLIELLRHSPKTINDLVGELKVTSNAVRQRLVRLMASSLITRQKSGEGRGRPSHEYLLTEDGQRTAGDNFSDLAKVLWQEIQSIEDTSIRRSLMAGAIRRLIDSYDNEVAGETVEQRLQSIQDFFGKRNIPITVEQQEGLPILKVLECPYPDLEDQDHQFCEMEKQLFAKVLGRPVQLCQCKKDGDGCCSFESSVSPS